MSEPTLKSVVEAALLAAGRPLSLDQLLGLFEEDGQPERGELRAAVKELGDDYAERALELREVASGYRLQVRETFTPWVSRLWEERPQRYSRALLETLALIAYRQPITRGEIEDIRGVAVSTNIMKTLQDRNWVRIVGHRDVPGRPAMFGTTREFLDYFGLKSLDELPTLAELRDIDSINVELDFGEDGKPASANDESSNDDYHDDAESTPQEMTDDTAAQTAEQSAEGESGEAAAGFEPEAGSERQADAEEPHGSDGDGEQAGGSEADAQADARAGLADAAESGGEAESPDETGAADDEAETLGNADLPDDATRH